MRSKLVSGRDVAELIGSDNACIIDLRDKERYTHSHIPTAIICKEDNDENNDEDIMYVERICYIVDSVINEKRNISKNNIKILLYCEHGGNSYRIAEQVAKRCNIKVMSLYGGIAGYRGKVCGH